MQKGEREMEHRKKLRDNEYNEIMMELAEIRTELHEVNSRVKKVNKFITWMRIMTWVKRIFIVLFLLGLAGLIQRYLPSISERVNNINEQVQKLHQLQTELTNVMRK